MLLEKDQISWILDRNGSCSKLSVGAVAPVTQLSDKQICKCMERFDNVYLIGTSHITIFGDYLMHTCQNLDFADMQKHRSLRTQTIQYL